MPSNINSGIRLAALVLLSLAFLPVSVLAVDAGGYVFRGDRDKGFDPVAEAGNYTFRSEHPEAALRNPNPAMEYRFAPQRERRRLQQLTPQPGMQLPQAGWPQYPPAQMQLPYAQSPQYGLPQTQMIQPPAYRPFGHAYPVTPMPMQPYAGMPVYPGNQLYPGMGLPQSGMAPGFGAPGFFPGYAAPGMPGAGVPGMGGTSLPFGSGSPGMSMPGSGFFRSW